MELLLFLLLVLLVDLAALKWGADSREGVNEGKLLAPAFIKGIFTLREGKARIQRVYRDQAFEVSQGCTTG